MVSVAARVFPIKRQFPLTVPPLYAKKAVVHECQIFWGPLPAGASVPAGSQK